jgi:hypothetical protein
MNPEHQAELEANIDKYISKANTVHTGAWAELVAGESMTYESDDWVDLCSRALVEVQQVQIQRIIRCLSANRHEMAATLIESLFLED